MDWKRMRRAIDVYRRSGSKQVLARLCSYGIIPPCAIEYAAYDLYRLKRFRRIQVRTDPRVSIGFASRSDISQLSLLTTAANSSEQQAMDELFGKFLREGGRCVAVRSGEQIVAYEWLFRNRYWLSRDELGPQTIEIRLGEGVFLSNGYILPSYRLKGLFPLMANFIVDSFPESIPVYTHIEKLNTPSKRAHERLGFEPVGGVEFWRITGLPHFWVLNALHKKMPVVARKRPLVLEQLVTDKARACGSI
ncbi:hypothetical protein [Thiohalomonas denitrificans]|uniref:N-acetyltransferase domain-containing protein n=1 Tax=Thiohalomonas denitrificans TaxID=415747 RepID=A0A1G5Q3D3_9GAMM|nr:hypothetical protein [Thiohalomonas denitrificans]SCZ55901.1 hypothetical protein SAMN03097708_01222 [Thiohalomonas denitrificans]